jgi:hypothetical protein
VRDETGTAAAANDTGLEAVQRVSVLQTGAIVTRPGPDRAWLVQVRKILYPHVAGHGASRAGGGRRPRR